jgi:hypothetical protein
MERLKIFWQTRYVENGVEEADCSNRWMIEGNLKIDCTDLEPYKYNQHHFATVAIITMKGTANASFVNHPSLPNFNVEVDNVLERGSLFNTGYGNTSQFFDTVDECKAFAERVINFHYDMLHRAEKT